uniref:Uncharacterized protein n=1 Tax=Lepeophtheirus salmonis TaxID=72036 RepID=A0A0K2UZH2_LEPSM
MTCLKFNKFAISILSRLKWMEQGYYELQKNTKSDRFNPKTNALQPLLCASEPGGRLRRLLSLCSSRNQLFRMLPKLSMSIIGQENLQGKLMIFLRAKTHSRLPESKGHRKFFFYSCILLVD